MTGFPRLPAGLDPDLHDFLERIAEALEVGEHQRGDPLERYIKAKDLIDLGIAERIGTGTGAGGDDGALEPTVVTGDRSTPPKPAGLTVTAGFSYIHIKWTHPVDLYNNHAYTVVYRNTEDNVQGAAIIGQVADGSQFGDLDVKRGVDYYYWIRFVSNQGVKGPYNSGAGTKARLSDDPAELLKGLSGAITQTQLYEDLNALIDKIGPNSIAIEQQETKLDGIGASYTVKIDHAGHVAGFGLATTQNQYSGAIHSSMLFSVDTFAVASPGATTMSFVVDNGRVVMDGAFIKDATITVAKIHDLTADNINGLNSNFIVSTIEDASITNAKIGPYIQSNNFQAGVQGWRILKSGNAEFHNIYARGNIEASTLKANIVEANHIKGGAVSRVAAGAASVGTLGAGQTIHLFSLNPNVPAGMSARVFVAVSYRGSATASTNIGATVSSSSGAGICSDQITAPAGNTVSGSTAGVLDGVQQGHVINVAAWNGWSSGQGSNVHITASMMVTYI